MKPLITSLYRLQFGKEFGFKDCLAILPYLKELGVEGVYACPIMKNIKGSPNQYMITSLQTINFELGDLEEFDKLLVAIQKSNMFFVLDLVPNHMAAHEENLYFSHVLRHGKKSPYASYFDIDFTSILYPELKGKVLLPILPRSLEQCIQDGTIKLITKQGNPYIQVETRFLPVNGKVSDKIEEVLANQYYQLAYWKDAYKKINYRRFFDINDLIGINMENPKLFKEFHQFLTHLSNQGKIQGIRIDHPDGLASPKDYFQMLNKRFPHLYIWAEKILQYNEELPSSWAIDGSVGYEFLNRLNGLFISKKNKNGFIRYYEQNILDKEIDLQKELFTFKKRIIKDYIFSEIHHLINKLYTIIRYNKKNYLGDYQSFKDHFIDFISLIDCYRLYEEKQEEKVLQQAFASMKIYSSFQSKQELKVLQELFVLRSYKQAHLLLKKLYQIMPCIFAKAYEDTLLYRFFPCLAANEVGSDLRKIGEEVSSFHEFNQQRQEKYPFSLLTTTTHDTKKSEDVRIRQCVITHDLQRWTSFVEQVEKIACAYHPQVDKNIRYFIYQTLIGFWTFEEVHQLEIRLKNYLTKALREAKEYSNWLEPNFAFEDQVKEFAISLVSDKQFIAVFYPYLTEIIEQGKKLSLSAMNIKMGSPGIVDVYQGHELFTYQLVDPDNRINVSYSKRESLLKEYENKTKIHYIQQALLARSKNKSLFLKGKYKPLTIHEEENAIAFFRTFQEKKALTISFLTCHPSAGYFISPYDFSGINIYTGQNISLSQGEKVDLKDLFSVDLFALFIGA